ncbi:MAG: hypothetical protein IJZ04_00810 [Clostridia bacterium]|nr:hypothetical protein [Clostridia bacterium]
MGFGIMLIGALCMLLGALTTLSPFTYVVGSAVVLYSLKELVRQNKVFVASMIAVAVELALSTVNMFLYVLSPNAVAIEYISLSLAIVNLGVCVLLITAIFILAKEVDLPKLQAKAVITYILMGIYLVAVLLLNTVFKSNEFAVSRLSAIVFFAQLLYVIMTLVVIANSYIRICYEEDKDMKSITGNKPLDFLNDKLNMAMTPKEKKELEKNKRDKGDKESK